MSSDTLFDPDLYGPGTKKRTKKVSPGLPVEDHVEPWALFRQRGGVAPYFHIPTTTNPMGASVAACGLQGTMISNPGVDQMIRCPVCVVALDMH